MKEATNAKNLRFNPTAPRQNTAFLLLNSEMAKLARQPQAKADWLALEHLCQRVFRAHGYDLQTGSWYCLILLRLNGWAGVAKGITMLSTALNFDHSDQSDLVQQREILTWCATHLVTPMYTLATSVTDSDELAQAAESLRVLSQMAKARDVRSHEMLSNLCYFLEIRARTPNGIVLDRDPIQPAQVVCKTAEPEPTIVEAQPVIIDKEDALLSSSVPKTRFWCHWLALGVCSGGAGIMLLICALWLVLRPATVSTAMAPLILLQQLDTAFQAAQLTQEMPSEKQWHDIEIRLQQLSQRPATWLLEQTHQLVSQLQRLQPDNRALQSWNSTFAQQGKYHDVAQSWYQIHLRLDNLEQSLLDSEKKQRSHMTISELKTEIYALRIELQQLGTPIPVLIHQLEGDKYLEINQISVRQKVEQYLNELSRNYVSLINKRP